MSLIIATGSNLNNPIKNLEEVKELLTSHFHLIKASRVYKSAAVDYLDQPDFYNQVLEFSIPKLNPEAVMDFLLNTEQDLGRIRDIAKGPRIIDLDIIFWGSTSLNTPKLVIPHPRWLDRSFIVRPLMELPFFQTIEKCFTIPKSFEVEAFPVN
jgi:2-amino-4-hydroxy-6-hydroxymethyldihydropteridine diphosphokinase